MSSTPRIFKCSGEFVHLVTSEGDLIKIDSKTKTFQVEQGENFDFAGSGLNFQLILREKNVYSKGQNKSGQLGCGDLKPREDEQFVPLSMPIGEVVARGQSSFAIVAKRSAFSLYTKELLSMNSEAEE